MIVAASSIGNNKKDPAEVLETTKKIAERVFEYNMFGYNVDFGKLKEAKLVDDPETDALFKS